MNTDRQISAALEKLEQAIIPPELLQDEDLSYVVRPLAVLNLLGTFLSIGYAVAWVFILPNRFERIVFPLAVALCSFIAVVLIRMKRVTYARNLTLTMTWVVLTLTIITAGGTRSPLFSMYSVIVLSAALYAGWWLALYFAGLTAALGIALLIADPTGTLLVPFATPQSGWFSQMSAMACACGMAYFMLQRSTDSLQRARKALEVLEQTQQSLRTSEERFRLIASVTTDYTFTSEVSADGNLQHQYSMLSGAFKEISGYTVEEFLSSGGWRATIHPDDLALDDRDFALLRANQPIITELRIIKKGGEVRWVRINAVPVWDEKANRLLRINGGVRDITERKQAETLLRQSEENLSALVNANTNSSFLMARDGTFLTLNQAMAKSLGKSIGELIGKNAFDFMNPVLRSQRAAHFETVVSTGQPKRWQDNAPAGTWDNSVYPVLNAAGVVEAFAVYSQDVTEQRRLEAELHQYTYHLETLVEDRTAALRHVNEQLELVLNNTRDALAFVDSTGNILVSNPAFNKTFSEAGTKAVERILKSFIHEQQMESVSDALVQVIYDNESRLVQVQIHDRDGEEKDIEITLLPVRASVDSTKAGVLLHAHDITQMKEIERFKEQFVADAMHDLATPISGISSRLYLLQREPHRLTDHIGALENQVRHLRSLLTDLRTMSQLDRHEITMEYVRYNINELMQRVFDTYEPVAMEKEQTLKIKAAESLPEVCVDPRQIERVLVNLVSNAVNYTPSQREIMLETVHEDPFFIIRVIDQGIGISTEDIPRIFERFYRTDEARSNLASGTGLGLSITKNIVEMHGGTIHVDSEVGKGSVFSVRIPIERTLPPPKIRVV